MMTKLREMTFIFIWILVFAFVALMVFEWGMDFTGLQGRSNVVGKIDGQKITIQEFQEAVQNLYLQERESAGQEPDEERMTQIRDQVWEQFVQQVLFKKEIERRNIQVTDREIYLYMTQNPQSLPPAISENPNFMTDGTFDMSKYRQALQNPQIDWTPVENYLREVLPYQKLQNIVTASVMVTEEELKSDYIENNQKAKMTYLMVPSSAFFKDSVKASDKEIRNYYEKNKEDFRIEERRKLNYVLFSTTPTAPDSQRIIKLAKEIKAEAEAGEDFAMLADEYSEDPSVRSNHGDLGYFEKDRMVPEFSEAAFSAKPGEIVGPIQTNFGVHIIKVHDKRVQNGQEQVHASHILLKFEPSPLTLENSQDLAGNFAETAREDGFKEAADNFNYEVKQTPEFPRRNYLPGFGQLQSAVEWSFNEKENAVSSVYRTPQGYVVFEVDQVLPKGYRPLEEVESICRSRVEQQKRLELAREFAGNIQEQLNTGKSLLEIAQSDESSMMTLDSTDLFTRSQPSSKIGRSPEVLAAAFSLPIDSVSGMLETDRGIYFIKVTERTEIDEESFKNQKDAIRTRLMNQKSQQFFAEWYDNLKEKSNIEDNRYMFFTS
ncbi:MAG: hypothetical protein EH225_01000 [Calditrichaeota bacterium]|nr:peptidyl-prolyl cis-trans isomerase [Calditrichota bacterium]RQW07871.1 MAG: hypothetical protein EH225_01000 [Calditrichota bacterium]